MPIELLKTSKDFYIGYYILQSIFYGYLFSISLQPITFILCASFLMLTIFLERRKILLEGILFSTSMFFLALNTISDILHRYFDIHFLNSHFFWITQNYDMVYFCLINGLIIFYRLAYFIRIVSVYFNKN